MNNGYQKSNGCGADKEGGKIFNTFFYPELQSKHVRPLATNSSLLAKKLRLYSQKLNNAKLLKIINMTNEQYYNLLLDELSKNIDLSVTDFNEIFNVPKQFIKYILPRDYKINFKDLKRNIVPNKSAFENFANKNPFASVNDFLHNFNANIRNEIIKSYERIGLNMTDYFVKKRKEIKSYYIENSSICNEHIADRFKISEHALFKVLRMELVPIRYEHNSKYTKYLADKLLPKGKLQGEVITDSDISDKNGFFCVVKHAKLMLLY